jgi:hypothetical protein
LAGGVQPPQALVVDIQPKLGRIGPIRCNWNHKNNVIIWGWIGNCGYFQLWKKVKADSREMARKVLSLGNHGSSIGSVSTMSAASSARKLKQRKNELAIMIYLKAFCATPCVECDHLKMQGAVLIFVFCVFIYYYLADEWGFGANFVALRCVGKEQNGQEAGGSGTGQAGLDVNVSGSGGLVMDISTSAV